VLTVEPHPLLDAGVFETEFADPLSASESPDWLVALLTEGAEAPISRDEEVRAAVRDLLRHGGYKPTGRGKPASEYLVRAIGEQKLGSINLAVDSCNAVSYHSGLPISVIDLERATPPLRLAIADEGTRYVFNASGQEMDVGRLLCLRDADGPCGNAVKDSQRTKTSAGTRRTLSVVWGTNALEGHTAAAVAWYRELLGRAGASTRDVGFST